MAIQQVTDQNFNHTVMNNKVVVVDFYADWCGPCRMLSPVLEQLSDEYGDDVTIAKVNVDTNPKSARQHQVMSIPTLKFYKDGNEMGTLRGLQSKDQLKNVIQTLLK